MDGLERTFTRPKTDAGLIGPDKRAWLRESVTHVGTRPDHAGELGPPQPEHNVRLNETQTKKKREGPVPGNHLAALHPESKPPNP
jgi:hypothetical protein